MRRTAIIALGLLSACERQEAANQSAPTAPAVEQPAGGGAERAAAALVPDYPGSVAIEVPNLGLPGTDSRSGNATMRETEATPDQVASFYREHFNKAGIPVRADTAGETGGLISVARDGERGAMLTISRVGAKTRIGVIATR